VPLVALLAAPLYIAAKLPIYQLAMDGLTLVKSLRALSQYKTVPILILTTESSDSMKAQGKAAGATGWIVKPFDPQKLLEVVGKVLG
jgi:two-component system chemotaxis response regulator CheY